MKLEDRKAPRQPFSGVIEGLIDEAERQ